MLMKQLSTFFCALAAMMAAGASPALAQTQPLPYEITFSSGNSSTWISLDLNGDGDNFGAKKWAWFNGASAMSYNLTSSQSGEGNDWLISPSFDLEGGRQYQVTYRFFGYSGSAKNIPVSLRLVTGTTAPETDLLVIAQYPPAEGGTTNKNSELYTATFTAPASGAYHIGAYLNAAYVPYTSGGPAEQSGRICFNYFKLEGLQKAAAPGTVTDFTVTPGANGEATATLSFKAPVADAEGNPLEGTVKVNLYREDLETPFFTSEALEPGASATAADTEALTGETWYIARAVNDSGEGEAVGADAWIGEDVPGAVTDLTAAAGADGKMTVSWTAPATAVHGGYVNFQALSYRVTRVADGEMTSLGAVSATSFTDSELSDAVQTNVSYQVVPQSTGGLGASSQTGIVNYGAQLTLPFAESFAGKAYQTSPWRQEVVFNFEDSRYEPAWELIDQATVVTDYNDDNPEGTEVVIASQDTDHGFIRFNSNQVGKMKEPAKGRLVSPSVDLSQMANPVLSFWMFRENYYTTNPATNGGYRDDHLTIEVASENGDFTPVEGAEFHRYSDDNAWTRYEVPLYTVAGKSRVQIGFTGAGFGGGPIYIDNIAVEEQIAYDLQAVALSGPSRVRVGETGNFLFSVKNAGGKEATGYQLELMKDGTVVKTLEGTALLPGKIYTADFEYVPANDDECDSAEFTARVVYAADQDESNNISNAVTASVTAPLLPAVTGLTAVAEGEKVLLAWEKADFLPSETLVENDGFESYEPFTFNTFGDFSCIDADKRITIGVGEAAGVTYPNSGEKMAFQIFAPSLTNIDNEELALWAPHSGSNMAIAPQAMSNSTYTACDDWLIFPQLSGRAQTVKFFARSFDEEGTEYIQGYYARTAAPTEPEDFLACPDGGDTSYAVPTEWTELTYSVPEGAKFFAIRHVSAQGYVLMIDDVTYQRSVPDADAAGLMGYNVYCNGEKINDEPVAARSYEHQPSASGEYEYTVAAVYPAGESSKCDAAKVNVELTGLEGVVSDGIAVGVNGLRVIVNAPESVVSSLYTPAGVLVDAGEGNSSLEAAVPGVYVLTVGDKVVKIVLK